MNALIETNSQVSVERQHTSTQNSQRPVRLPNKRLFVGKKKSKRRRTNQHPKMNKNKFKHRLQGSNIFDTKRKYKSPTILGNRGMEPIATSTPKLIETQGSSKSIKDIKTVYRVNRQMPKANFRVNRMTSINQFPVSVDKYGNKLGFGSDLNFFTIQQDSKRDYNNRLSLNSRGTVLRMFSDTESEFNAIVHESVKPQIRNLSQPNLPTTITLIDKKTEEKPSQSNLPSLQPKDRLSTPAYVGEEAYRHFYTKYKRLSKEKERSPAGYSATTAYLTSWEQLKISPTPIGLIKWEGDKSEIDAHNYLMGGKYAMALSSSMKYLKTEKLNLWNNNLGSYGASAILSNLSETLKELDLSKNNMGDEAMPKLVSWLESMPGKWKLKYLNLAGNKLADKSLYNLCEALIFGNPPLKVLDLSHNSLGQQACTSLGDFIRHSEQLKILRLQWNKMHADGGVYLCENIALNQTIKNIDMSWNMMGANGNKKTELLVTALAKIVNAGSVVHLDISYNSFNLMDSQLFGDLIRENHTLYGLHMHGNKCMVDTYGVVRTEKKFNPENYGKDNYIGYHSTDGRSVQIKERKLKIAKIRSHAHCWVCEGWRKEKFTLTVEKSHKKLFDPVYIHFDFDDYKPDLMMRVEPKSRIGPVRYVLIRMVPPGKSMYFFTVNHESFHAQDHPKVYNKIKISIKNVEFDEVMEDDGRPPDSDEEEEETVFSYSIGVMNYTSGKTRSVIDEDYNPINSECHPRPPDKVYVRPRNRRPKTPWSIPISLFKDYVIENEELLNKWFEFDWSCLKLPKMTEEEMDELKEELKKGYRIFKSAYKYLSGVGTGSGGGVFAIPLNCYTDFVKQIDLVNGRDIRFAESDTLFLTMNKRSKNSYLNPGVALIRYQFLEILTRLALKRYEDTKQASSKGEAIRMMYEKNLYPSFGKDHPQKFRDDRYWIEEVDNLYKSHIQLFEYLYKNYGGTHMKPGDQWFMTTDELEAIFADSGLINDQLVSRDIAVFYNLAMMTQVDEINKDRHLRMSFVEFLEAVARCAEQISSDPFEKERLKKSFEEESLKKELKKKGTSKLDALSVNARGSARDSGTGNEPEGFEDAAPSMSKEEREAQPLVVKLENIIPRIYMSCTTNAFKEKWEWPSVDPFTGLYVEGSKKKMRQGQPFSQSMSSKKMSGLLKANN